MRDSLLYCTCCSSFTLSHGMDKESGLVWGESSLLHNEYDTQGKHPVPLLL